MRENLMQGNYLVSLLKSTSSKINEFAMNQMKSTMHFRWTFYVESVEILKQKYEEQIELRELTAFLLSQIYFFSSQIEQAVTWALKSGSNFNIQERSIYTDSILTNIVDNYIRNLDRENSQLPESIFKEYEAVVFQVMNTSFELNRISDKKLLVGLAIETNQLEFVERYLTKVQDKQLNSVFTLINTYSQNKENQVQVNRIFLKELLKREKKHNSLISQCFMKLNLVNEHSEFLAFLYKTNPELSLQLMVDVQETGNLFYIDKLTDILKEKITDNFENVQKILNGKFREELNNLFLTQNNHVDLVLFKELIKKWNAQESISSNSFALFFLFSLIGTEDISPFKEEKILAKFENVDNWSLFTLVGSLGQIFKSNKDFTSKLLELKIKQTNDYAKGGMLFAKGFQEFGIRMKEDEVNQLNTIISNQNTSQGNKHGAALQIGLSYVFSNDTKIVEILQQQLYGEKSNLAEACGYALGLVKATHFDLNLIEEMINSSRNNPHDRIARSMMISLGCMGLGNKKKVFLLFEKLIKEQDHQLRMGAVNLISMAYVNTEDNDVLDSLLQIAATDLSNDVRRSAVIGIGFVLLSNRQKALNLMTMLANSYNEYVRHAVAIALGILGAGKYDSKIHQLLKVLWEDKTFHIKQAVGIAWGMLTSLSTEQNCSFVKEVRDLMKENLDSKHQSNLTKMGVLSGLGLMQAGGGNQMISLVTKEGNPKLKNILGLYMFTQYWYWYPLSTFLGLALEPTYLAGITKDLKIPRSFAFVSKAPKTYFDYYQTKTIEKEEMKKGPVTLSTTKKILSKKNKDKKEEEKQQEQEKQVEKQEMEIEETVEKQVVLNNPSRVVWKQEAFIEYIQDQRYQVVQKSRHNGIVFLKDGKSELPEVYMNDLPKETNLIPPQDFVFDENKNK